MSDTITPEATPAVAPEVPTSQEGFQAVPPAGGAIRPPNSKAGWVPQGVQAPAAPPKAGPPVMAQVDTPPPVEPPQDALPLKEGFTGLNTYDITNIEDPIIRSMASVLQLAGKDLDLDRVLGRALSYGDPNLIDLAYLAEKSGENAGTLAEVAKGIVLAVEQKAQEAHNAVYAIAGGQQQWQAAVAAFNQSAPHELRVTVAQMLDSAQSNLVQAGAKLVAQYGQGSGLIPKQGTPLLNTAGGASTMQGISKEQYQAELRKLDLYSPEYISQKVALTERRALGKRIGL